MSYDTEVDRVQHVTWPAGRYEEICFGLSHYGLYWNRESHGPGTWDCAILDSMANAAAYQGMPLKPHGHRIGSGPWLADLVWTLGDPKTESLYYVAMALNIELGWGASDEPGWRRKVIPHLKSLMHVVADERVFVTSVPRGWEESFSPLRALDELAHCVENHGYQDDILLVVLSAPWMKTNRVALRACSLTFGDPDSARKRTRLLDREL